MFAGVTDTAASTKPLATAGEPIPHSSWDRRSVYVWLVTGALLGFAGRAMETESDAGLDLVGFLLSFLFVLYIVAPSAEQAVKMLATVAALRAGVSFASSSDVNAREGTASSTSTATPAAAATPATTPAADSAVDPVGGSLD